MTGLPTVLSADALRAGRPSQHPVGSGPRPRRLTSRRAGGAVSAWSCSRPRVVGVPQDGPRRSGRIRRGRTPTPRVFVPAILHPPPGEPTRSRTNPWRGDGGVLKVNGAGRPGSSGGLDRTAGNSRASWTRVSSGPEWLLDGLLARSRRRVPGLDRTGDVGRTGLGHPVCGADGAPVYGRVGERPVRGWVPGSLPGRTGRASQCAERLRPGRAGHGAVGSHRAFGLPSAPQPLGDYRELMPERGPWGSGTA